MQDLITESNFDGSVASVGKEAKSLINNKISS